MDDLLSEFVTETSETLAVVDAQLLRLARNPADGAVLGNVFRLLHTIKGASGFMGLSRLEAASHAGETVLGRLREGTLEITPEALAPVFACVHTIRDIVGGLEADGGRDVDGDDRGFEAAAATVRIEARTLDALATLIGELTAVADEVLPLAKAIAEAQGQKALAADLRRLRRITRTLSDTAVATRMQPIGNAWARLPRLVRSLGVETGKRIALKMAGAKTELDRRQLELVGDPLIHLVRNAADHGIEPPADRLKVGKPETGTITLSAVPDRHEVTVRIADDGRGLDRERVRRKAREHGLAGFDGAAAWSPATLGRCIFTPGFSTADAVTRISGRGVGLDVVRSNVAKAGGRVELRSVPGGGTIITLRLPRTHPREQRR